MNNTLKKIFGTILFLWGLKYILQFVFGAWVEIITSNYLVFVGLGLIPATLAVCKGESFYGWWIIGTLAPVISTIYVLGMENPNDSSKQALDALQNTEKEKI